MAAEPTVAVVIPTYRGRDSLRDAILSLAAQTVDPESFEVVIAVDGDDDATLAALRSLKTAFRLRWLVGEHRGRAAACNMAIAEADAEVLVILDDDMAAAPQLIERHRSHHPPGSRKCVLGAVPVALDRSSSRAAAYVKARFDLHLRRLADREHLERPRSFYTGNASLRAEVMAEVGGFDQGFGAYGNEDVELALRLRDAGVGLVYDPDALAEQSYRKDLRGLQRDTLEKGGTAVLLARRHPEVFSELRLAEPRESKRPWLAARAVLLAITRRMRSITTVVFAVAAGLEWIGMWRSPLFYRAVLDYAFWAGVEAELGKGNDGGELAALEMELNRGPIDLLLHR